MAFPDAAWIGASSSVGFRPYEHGLLQPVHEISVGGGPLGGILSPSLLDIGGPEALDADASSAASSGRGCGESFGIITAIPLYLGGFFILARTRARGQGRRYGSVNATS